MSNDRSWIYRRISERGRLSEEYRNGVSNFINFALENGGVDSHQNLRCPCSKCRNALWSEIDVVRLHLYTNGFVNGYLIWDKHGERKEPGEQSAKPVSVENSNEDNYDVVQMLSDAFNGPNNFDWNTHDETADTEGQLPNDNAVKYYKILSDVGVPLYEGSVKHTVLSAMTKLLHFKNETGCSERGFNDLLSLIGEFLPKDHKLPSTYYEIKKMVRSLNLGYEKIDACENDCMLYYGDDADKLQCDFCHLVRYKTPKCGGKQKNVPRKILRYFPLAPRLQRLFMSSHTAEYMRWHKNRDITPDHLTHPADGDEWKQFDKNFPSFAVEARNVRLGLATDGFSPFNSYGRAYSVWPVIMIAYNLPPSMCMKDPYMFLSLLIPGPNSPKKDINVYLRPLVNELKLLWETGVQTYDKSLKDNFMMRAALLWTITDFPALGMISGWSTHGKLSCHVCMGDVQAFQLKNGRKPCYFGTARKFLPPEHKFRMMSTQFNKRTEEQQVHNRLSGDEVLRRLKKFKFPPPGLINSKVRVADYGKSHNWTHECMFFELPYWTTLKVRHCIDVMHTEKNVFDNLFYTMLDVSGKTKDNVSARLDLKLLKIRRELWPHPDGISKPKAKYTLSKQQLDNLCKWLSALKLPDGYAANISRCTKGDQLKVVGLKSHDCHVFMQKLLPIAFRDMLPNNVHDALIEISTFFRDICSAQINYKDIELMEKNIVLTLCKLEMIFPPSLFDSMEHLPIHLPYELKLGGPVQYRWMYPFERYMGRLKRKVKNKARVEGSISERYTEEELVNFCSLYFEEFICTKHNRLSRNEVPVAETVTGKELAVFCYPAKPFGPGRREYIDENVIKKVGMYVFLNSPEISPYMKLFEDEAYDKHPALLPDQFDELVEKNFKTWFERRVKEENKYEYFADLIHGPYTLINSYDACTVNGYRFKVDDVNELTSVNSGVVVLGSCYSDFSSNYYGRLEEVVVLNYPRGNKVITFKCRWFDTEKGVKIDKHKIVTVDVKSKLNSDDVFVLASQATQVYYASNVVNPKNSWYTVVTTKTKSFDDTNISELDDVLQENISNSTHVHITKEDLQQNLEETRNIEDHDVVDDFIIVDEEEELEEEEEEETLSNEDETDGDESDGYY